MSKARQDKNLVEFMKNKGLPMSMSKFYVEEFMQQQVPAKSNQASQEFAREGRELQGGFSNQQRSSQGGVLRSTQHENSSILSKPSTDRYNVETLGGGQFASNPLGRDFEHNFQAPSNGSYA